MFAGQFTRLQFDRFKTESLLTMMFSASLLCVALLLTHSYSANVNHEDVRTINMFPQHYQDGVHDPEFDHTAFLGGIVSIKH